MHFNKYSSNVIILKCTTCFVITFLVFCIGCCYSTLLKNSHPCVEGAMHHDCPVCFEVSSYSFYDLNITLTAFRIVGGWFKHTKFDDCSICLNQETMSLLCHVDIRSIRAAWMKWENISSEYHKVPHLPTSPFIPEKLSWSLNLILY